MLAPCELRPPSPRTEGAGICPSCRVGRLRGHREPTACRALHEPVPRHRPSRGGVSEGPIAGKEPSRPPAGEASRPTPRVPSLSAPQLGPRLCLPFSMRILQCVSLTLMQRIHPVLEMSPLCPRSGLERGMERCLRGPLSACVGALPEGVYTTLPRSFVWAGSGSAGAHTARCWSLGSRDRSVHLLPASALPPRKGEEVRAEQDQG